MGDTESILRKAKDLFSKGSYGEAEALLRDHDDTSTAVLNFRAYLLYRQDRHEEAEEAYSRLVERDEDTSHLVSLGLIRFKLNRIEEAREAFEQALSRSPGDKRALRSLGQCYRRLGDERRAADCFSRAGVREGAGPSQTERAAEPPSGAAGSFASRLREYAQSSPGPGAAGFPAGPEALFLHLEEKMYIGSRHLLTYSGVIVFSPVSRDARKGAARFGGRGGEIVRVEGTGELGLTGRGGGLHELNLSAGEVVAVNYPALALYGDGIEALPSLEIVLPGSFMAVTLRGEGRVVLAARNPAVLAVHHDCPVFVRPSAAVAWAGELDVLVEQGPVSGRLFGRKEGNRFLRFEGEGHLLIQSR